MRTRQRRLGFETFEQCLGTLKQEYVTLYINIIMQKRVTGQCKKHEWKCLDRVAGENHNLVLKPLSEENWSLE